LSFCWHLGLAFLHFCQEESWHIHFLTTSSTVETLISAFCFCLSSFLFTNTSLVSTSNYFLIFHSSLHSFGTFWWFPSKVSYWIFQSIFLSNLWVFIRRVFSSCWTSNTLNTFCELRVGSFIPLSAPWGPASILSFQRHYYPIWNWHLETSPQLT
jgi:hypothetical protein